MGSRIKIQSPPVETGTPRVSLSNKKKNTVGFLQTHRSLPVDPSGGDAWEEENTDELLPNSATLTYLTGIGYYENVKSPYPCVEVYYRMTEVLYRKSEHQWVTAMDLVVQQLPHVRLYCGTGAGPSRDRPWPRDVPDMAQHFEAHQRVDLWKRRRNQPSVPYTPVTLGKRSFSVPDLLRSLRAIQSAFRLVGTLCHRSPVCGQRLVAAGILRPSSASWRARGAHRPHRWDFRGREGLSWELYLRAGASP